MGKRGPTPMSQGLRVIRGDGRPSRARESIEATIPDAIPEPPSWLSEQAYAEWRAVAGELHKLGLLSILDVGPLSAWCCAVATWKSALGALAQLPDDERLFSPLAKVARDAAKQMMALGQPFGLSGPASRQRLSGHGKQQPASKFHGLLGRDPA